MDFNPEKIIKKFTVALQRLQDNPIVNIEYDVWKAPHTPKNLKRDHGAVYVFMLAHDIKGGAPKERVLKVGKVGPNSNARFRSQHYNPNAANSTLAGAIINNPILWDYIGFLNGLDDDVGEWLKENTHRCNFYIHKNNRDIIRLLEIYIKAITGPVFEGSLSTK